MRKKLTAAFLAALTLGTASCSQIPKQPAPMNYAATPAMTSLSTNTASGYLGAISGDKAKDDEIWAFAEKLYNEWYARYQEITSKTDPVIDKIVDDDAEYSTRVEVASNVGKPFLSRKTRLLVTLKNFTPASENVKTDVYGGFKIESMKQEVRGVFYTTQIDGRWWFIDPLGYPFYMVGVSRMGIEDGGAKNQKDPALAIYGSKEKWAIAAVKKLKNMGFNSCTRLSTAELETVEENLNYQIGLGFLDNYEISIGTKDTDTASGSTLLKQGMHVFDPGFVDFCNNRMKQRVRNNTFINNPNLVGYTTDNEIPVDDKKMGLVLNLTLDITNTDVNYYSYAAAWTFLAHMAGKENPTLDDANDAKLKEIFRGYVYDRYFAVVTNAIRRYDDKHLILGCRALNGARTSEWICRASGYWCDVVTFNWYHDWTPDATVLQKISAWTNKPILITEYYAKAEECEGNLGNTSGAGWYVHTQKERGMFYQNFTLQLLESKNVVGWHWFQYIDADPAAFGQKAANKGIYSNTHKEYTDLTDYMIPLNENIYGLIRHFDAK